MKDEGGRTSGREDFEFRIPNPGLRDGAGFWGGDDLDVRRNQRGGGGRGGDQRGGG